jgi:hypothetical protein
VHSFFEVDDEMPWRVVAACRETSINAETLTVVPEPGAVALLVAGLIALRHARRAGAF